MSTTSTPRDQFVAETFRLAHAALGAERLAFYQVDAQQNLRDFVFASVPPEFHRIYEREMFAVDPLHVQRVGGHGVKVARFSEASRYAPVEQVRHYAAFLRRFEVRDTLELLLRDEGGVVAGLNVSWTDREKPPSAATYALAETLQRYIEFAWRRCCRPAGERVSQRALELGLTQREAEVAKLVCAGHKTSGIAARLRVKPSTIKTHLLHIYEKCGVQSRAGLVAELSGAAS